MDFITKMQIIFWTATATVCVYYVFHIVRDFLDLR